MTTSFLITFYIFQYLFFLIKPNVSKPFLFFFSRPFLYLYLNRWNFSTKQINFAPGKIAGNRVIGTTGRNGGKAGEQGEDVSRGVLGADVRLEVRGGQRWGQDFGNSLLQKGLPCTNVLKKCIHEKVWKVWSRNQPGQGPALQPE